MKKKYLIIYLSIISLLFSSCDEILEVNPRQSIDASTALNTAEGVNAALTNVYSFLKSVNIYGRNLLQTSECLADNARVINRAGGRYNDHAFNVINVHIGGGWNTFYNAINQCNLILKALPALTGVTDTVKDELEGQTKALRAIFYFNLARVFAYEPNMAITSLDKGGVPLLTEGVSSIEQVTFPARASVQDVYAQIYADLQVAIAKAPASASVAPNRITRGAALAIFSRIALYNQDWNNVITYATQALASGVGSFQTKENYVSAWRQSRHPESMFEIVFVNPSESIGVNESVQSAYTTRISLTANTLGGWGAVVPTNAFLALMPVEDVRAQLYQTGLNRSGVTAIECTKFLGKTGTTYMDNIPVIRISEMYLNRAEAHARLGNTTQALADLNQIRTRAGLTAIPDDGSVTGQALIDAVLLQRRIELAFEGDRWFDLKRNGLDVIKSTGNVVYTDVRILAPIPLSEILVNPQLVQNSGY